MGSVADAMSGNVLTIGPTELVREAAARMVGRRVGSIVVLADDRLVGILTERDVMRAVAAGASDSAAVADWMTAGPETVERSETVEHAAVLMLQGGFRHLPVVEDGRPIGMLSIRDLLGASLAEQFPRGV
jgi:CBS domain-containing protein